MPRVNSRSAPSISFTSTKFRFEAGLQDFSKLDFQPYASKNKSSAAQSFDLFVAHMLTSASASKANVRGEARCSPLHHGCMPPWRLQSDRTVKHLQRVVLPQGLLSNILW